LIIGAIAWVIWSIIPKDEGESPPRRPHLDAAARNFYRAGAIAFLFGMGIVLAAIIFQAREQPRPSITASSSLLRGKSASRCPSRQLDFVAKSTYGY
jgi:hypothetical protein